jgi:class 3 adenylate cyclase
MARGDADHVSNRRLCDQPLRSYLSDDPGDVTPQVKTDLNLAVGIAEEADVAHPDLGRRRALLRLANARDVAAWHVRIEAAGVTTSHDAVADLNARGSPGRDRSGQAEVHVVRMRHHREDALYVAVVDHLARLVGAAGRENGRLPRGRLPHKTGGVNPFEVHYAWNGDVALAYQVFGAAGGMDLVYLQGFASHIDFNWESPYLARFLTGLGRLARVIHTDRRGWGCSDRFSPGDVAALEVQVDDLQAVMDAAGSARAVIFASTVTAPAAILFAASFPERVAGLVLCDPFVAFYDSEEARRDWVSSNERARREWGTPAYYRELFADDREFLGWFVPWCRAAVAPGALVAEADRFGAVDVRGVLSAIRVPTVLAGRAGDPDIRARHWRDAAAGISHSRFIEPTPTSDAGPFHWYGRSEAVLAAVGELIDGIDEEERSFDRVLATVLFSDIVASTEAVVALGDDRWRDVVERHHAVVRGLLARYRGKEVDTAGDGFFATFDGPARAVRCSQAIVEAVHELGLEVRIGVHTGEIETINGKVGGIAVHVGARISAMAKPSQTLVSSTVKDLTMGSGMVFVDAGEHELKGVPDRWHLYSFDGTR